jgi:hypothetical protein
VSRFTAYAFRAMKPDGRSSHAGGANVSAATLASYSPFSFRVPVTELCW